MRALLTDLERLQHRAVVLDRLAEEVLQLFLGEGEIPPRYLIGIEDGVAAPARFEVVEMIHLELRRAADMARDQIRRRLQAKLAAPVVEDVPSITRNVPAQESVAEDDGTLVQLLSGSVPNPTISRRR